MVSVVCLHWAPTNDWGLGSGGICTCTVRSLGGEGMLESCWKDEGDQD